MHELIRYFDRVRERTIRVIGCIPRERFDWTYKPGKYTFADLIRHLGAIERWMFAENAQRRPSLYPGHGKDLADGYDDVLAYIGRMHKESMAIFSSLTDEQMREKCVTPGGAELAVEKWLRSMIEHEAHHRGQIYLYLAMLDIPAPPLYGLTEEQVRDASS